MSSANTTKSSEEMQSDGTFMLKTSADNSTVPSAVQSNNTLAGAFVITYYITLHYNTFWAKILPILRVIFLIPNTHSAAINSALHLSWPHTLTLRVRM